jgi:hypothetical protein
MTPDSSRQFLFDYSDASITNVYKANVKNNDGYIEVPLKSPGQSPNAICLPKNTKYKVEKLYIFKNIHTIEKQQYDGELIIEHTPITNDSGNKIYSCFLLKTDATSNTDNNIIDKIITRDFESTQNVNINNLINPQLECITNKKNNVFIFTNPILVKSNFTNFDNNVKNILFDKYVSNDYQNTIAKNMTESSKEGFQEGFKEGLPQDYLECSPTGASEATVEMVSKINGDDMINKSKIEVMRTTIHFFVFIIIIGLSLVITPFFYLYFVVNLIKNSGIDDTRKQGSLSIFNIFLIAVFFSMSIVICVEGMNTNNSTETSIGIVMFLFILLSFCMIIFLRMTDPSRYALKADDDTPSSWNIDFLMEFFGFFKYNWKDVITILIVWVAILLVFSFFMFYAKGFSKNASMNTKIKDFTIYMGLGYGSFIIYYIIYIFSQKKLEQQQ